MPETDQDTTDQVHELVGLDIDTVGLVGKAANKRRFLLFKSQKGGHIMPDEIKVESLEQAEEAVAKAKTVEEVTGVLGGFVRLLKGMLKTPSEGSGVGSGSGSGSATGQVVKAEDPRVEDLIKATDDLKAKLEKAQERIDKAEQVAMEERGKRELAEFVATASQLALPIDVEKTGELLQWVAKTDPDQAAVLTDILKSASQAMVLSGVFDETGTQRAPVVISEFEEAISARADELRKNDPGLSEVEAEIQAQRAIRKEKPHLARAYLQKRQRETGRK